MTEINQKKILTIIIAITISLIAIILTCGFTMRQNTDTDGIWVLHSYGNNVALYKNDQIIEIYGQIALDTRPKADKLLLDNGRAFRTREEAVSAIEDYDG